MGELSKRAGLLPRDSSFSAHLFIGGILTATSVGIAARVLRDLHQMNLRNPKIIGAAVTDDVVLAVVLALVESGSTNVGNHIESSGVSVFPVGSIGIGSGSHLKAQLKTTCQFLPRSLRRRRQFRHDDSSACLRQSNCRRPGWFHQIPEMSRWRRPIPVE